MELKVLSLCSEQSIRIYWVSSIHCTSSHPVALKSTAILSPHLCPGNRNGIEAGWVARKIEYVNEYPPSDCISKAYNRAFSFSFHILAENGPQVIIKILDSGTVDLPSSFHLSLWRKSFNCDMKLGTFFFRQLKYKCCVKCVLPLTVFRFFNVSNFNIKLISKHSDYMLMINGTGMGQKNLNLGDNLKDLRTVFSQKKKNAWLLPYMLILCTSRQVNLSLCLTN